MNAKPKPPTGDGVETLCADVQRVCLTHNATKQRIAASGILDRIRTLAQSRDEALKHADFACDEALKYMKQRELARAGEHTAEKARNIHYEEVKRLTALVEEVEYASLVHLFDEFDNHMRKECESCNWLKRAGEITETKKEERMDIAFRIAEVCHEVNRAYCQALGDDSQVPWSEAPAWQKDSAVSGVRMHQDNPDATAAMSHECWLSEKTEAGWKHGRLKSETLKTHPCMVPFNELPVDQKAKDYIFRAIVHALLKENGT